MTSTIVHRPVMADRVVDLLVPALDRPGAVLADLTLGLGGHAAALLERCPGARLLGVDRDPQALTLAAGALAPYAGRTEFVQAVFDELPAVLADHALDHVDAVLLDLGLSSLQIDDTERGFAYATDAPLDMRMTPGAPGPTAADIVNTWSKADLTQLLHQGADERFAGRIAAAIVVARAEAPFETSARLVDVISGAIPLAARHTGGHPAKRTFQALRLAVNHELEALAAVLPAALAALRVGGRIAVLAYHSGEDRLV
jgi:16S rRNA (cytosine1402-N4)-methyltransferase